MASKQEFPKQETPRTPTRVMKAMEAFLALAISDIKVISSDPELELDPTRPYIVAISHKTGLDVPIVVAALGNQLPLAISDQSIHHGPMTLTDPTTISVKLLGQDNFPPISYVRDENGKRPVFNPADIAPMITAMEAGKSIVVAAHNPSDEIPVQDIHKVSPGYMAALLAHETGAQILPVLVDIDEKGSGILTRKGARVYVGRPYTIDIDPAVVDMGHLMEKRSRGAVLTSEETQRVRHSARILRKTGRQILDSICYLDGWPTLAA